MWPAKGGWALICILSVLPLWALSSGVSAGSSRRPKYGIDGPERGPSANLDRSKRLREGVFEPTEFGTIQSDIMHAERSDLGSERYLPIIGQNYLDSSSERGSSVLSDPSHGIELARPYEGVYVDYNLTSFSRFISRIVEMELEMHLNFEEAAGRRPSIRKREREALRLAISPQGVPQQGRPGPQHLELQSLSFFFIAGYFVGERSLRQFVPIFQDNITLSRQNANQYYARFGITTFKDRLTAVLNERKALGPRMDHPESKINVDQHKLTFLYLPHNDTHLFFSSGGDQRLVLPKLHIKAIQTHQEANDEPEPPSTDGGSNAKRVVIIAFLLFTMFTSFLVLFYILITWYIRGIQKHS
ncbi:hypothetical protein OJ253_3350 [Cryptosporidium canis]|uniref:Transmembrane protein n=1 Tax=Cryptosporidium canis TaxID=195482 RepID=A0A9D5HW91_9CRYT|nr:hypothetical protein OJ253_3350 [Cryptosporidium canis]